MAIDTVTPVSGTLLAFGDSVSFTVDDTYTTMLIQVVADAATESAYDSSLGGAQPGYTISVVNSGGRDTFTVARTLGWDNNPLNIYVTEDETGTSALTNINYTLTVETPFPQNKEPYNPIHVGTLLISEADVEVADDVNWIDFDTATFDVTDLQNGKVRITGIGGGSNLSVEQDGVELSAAATKLNFLGSLVLTESPANEFAIQHQAQQHNLTDTFGGNVLLLWQGDNGLTDDTGNHTFGSNGSPEFGMGHIPGVRAAYGTEANGNWWTTAGAQGGGGQTTHRRGAGEAVSAYALIYHDSANSNSTPYYILSGVGGAGSTINYAIVLVGEQLHYQDSGSGGTIDSGVRVPRNVWTHVGFTRNASNVVNIYMNGDLIATSGALNTPTAAGDFYIAAAGVAANGYIQFGYIQSLKVLDVELTAAQMLQEARRALGR